MKNFDNNLNSSFKQLKPFATCLGSYRRDDAPIGRVFSVGPERRKGSNASPRALAYGGQRGREELERGKVRGGLVARCHLTKYHVPHE